MKYALIKDGVIVNVIHAEDGFTPPDGMSMMLESDAIAAQIPRAEKVVNLLDDGYLVETEGFRLAIGEGDRSAFIQMLGLVREALDLGVITDETPQTIADKDSVVHTVTTLRFRQIMVGYGTYCKSLWDAAKAS